MFEVFLNISNQINHFSQMKKNFDNIIDFEDEGDDENDSDQLEESKTFETKTGAFIYLIDARKKMFLPSFEEDKLPIILSLESIRKAMRKKIFRMEKCICCIILLGTRKSENALSLNNITVIQELEALGTEHVLKIDELIKAVENLSFGKEYGHDKFSLGDALWLSSHSFNQKSGNLNKTVVLFTNDDGPTSDDPHDENRAVTNAQDMYKSFVTFDLVSLGRDFDLNKFYKKIIIASKNDANYVIPDPVTSIDQIVDRITKANFKHVNMVKLPFVISKDFQIGVSVHFLVKKAKIPFKIKLSKATNERVFTKTEYFEEETGSLVNKNDLIKTQIVAQKEINFRLSELRTIQMVGKRELKLLGFKPSSLLRLENFVRPCAFIYPDDSEYQGSSLFFTALLKRCIAKQVVAICTFCPRTSSSYRFVALIPQDEFPQSEKNLRLPPGFVVFFLPFAEEVRTIEDKTTERATPEQVSVAMSLIKKLKFPYTVSCFQNPKIRQHWLAIEALALDLKEPEEFSDSTNPNYDLISQRCGHIAREFVESVYEEDYDPQTSDPPKKTSKARFSKPMSQINIDSVEEYMREGKGEQLPNEVLKNYLRSVGDPKGLSKIKKSDLLEKVRAHLNLS